MFRDFGDYESRGEKFYYIETGIEVDRCQKHGNYIVGRGEVIYYKTQEDYENNSETATEPFRFEWTLVSDRIEIFECEYDKDIDLEALLENLKNNVLPQFERE
jgi:hypothetical protein